MASIPRPKEPHEPDLLTARLERWAEERGTRRAVVFCGDGENETGALTFAELCAASQDLAGTLHAQGVAGQPVLILLRSGLEFAVAFLACLRAGGIAVPCSTGRTNQGWERIAAIVADARPALALGSTDTAELLAFLTGLGIPSLRMDGTAGCGQGVPAAASADVPALLQYTSGSTGSPKGVIVTQRNLASNLEMLRWSFGVRDDSVCMSWLPLFHDMGLIANLLTAIHCGVTCVLMPPLAFYQKPRRWLAAIGRYRATISGGPNFGFEFCARRFAQMDLSAIDLSSWEVAFCGAEPVRPATMQRFGALFSGVGFRPSALYPCYGLAEATVFVTGSERNAGVRLGRAEDGSEVVSCGGPAPGGEVLIVEPESGTQLADGSVGEVWVRGDHVAKGYWRKAAETEATFAARLNPDDGRRFLRTGDLGWMRDGSLYLSGRLKDLIVYRGTNIHPEDIEATVAQSHPSCGDVSAAFSIEAANQEQVVVVQELARSARRDLDVSPVLSAIVEAVANAHGLHLHDALLVRSGAVPRTTSGKVQRQLCREFYRDGRLQHAVHASLRGLRTL